MGHFMSKHGKCCRNNWSCRGNVRNHFYGTCKHSYDQYRACLVKYSTWYSVKALGNVIAMMAASWSYKHKEQKLIALLLPILVIGLFWKSFLLSAYPCLFTGEYTCTRYRYQKFWCYQLYQGNSSAIPLRASYQLCHSGGQVNKT